jgi:AcrB/AcrD/AcrF family protein
VFSRFFIDRPIFAAVLSAFVVLAGLAAMRVLPVAQYPEIAPPVVTVQAVYPGASAQVLEQTVAAPLENQINGVEHMIYMNSTSTSQGVVQIQVTFDIGTDPDKAALNVNNRVKQAEPRLPLEVRRQGVTVEKGSSAFLQVLAFYSPEGRHSDVFISNYVTLNVLDLLKRVPGTTNVQIFGAKDYAMRIWVQPDRMTQHRLTPADLIRVVNEQNAQFAAGKVGQSPAPPGQELVYTVTTRGRLSDPREFEEILVRTNSDGSSLRLKDVARVELASKDYDFIGRINGREATLVGIFLQPGANALGVAGEVKRTVADIAKRFPQGLAYSVPYDTTRFVEVSIKEVVETLLIAMLLVFMVVYLFLQSWRATLIPFAAVPVSLIGTFAGLLLLGYSINTLTLFGMVLAIGIVVDDAIVVLENVERIMHEEGLPPRDAAIKAMKEVTSPIVAIVLVLCAVFVPIAFLGGLTGELYRQFAVTISMAVVISGIVALTLTPSLCVIVLKPEAERKQRGFFRWFNNGFARATDHYESGVAWIIRRGGIGLALFGCMVAAAAWLWHITPGSLVPDEDQGFYIAAVILPDGATLERTDKVVAEVNKAIASNPNNLDVVAFTGFDFLGGGFRNNAATIFVTQKPWSERKVTTPQLVGDFFMKTAHIKEGLALAFGPPPIFGLGTAGGFEFYIQNRGTGGPGEMAKALGQFIGAAALGRRRPRPGEGARRAARGPLRRARGHAGQLLRERLQQIRPHLAGADVGRAAIPRPSGGYRQGLGALCGGSERRLDDSARLSRQGALQLRPGLARPLQQSAGGEDLRPGRARGVFGAGDPGGRKHREQGAAAGLQLRLGRRLVPGKALRRDLGPGARPGGRDGVPDSGRAIREVVAAALGAPGDAVRHVRRARGRLVEGSDQRRVLPDRPGHAARPGGEERHPDRRVRGDEARAGAVGVGRRGRGGAAALPADPDDLARLHPRGAAARDLDRRRRRRARVGGHGRHGRDAGGDLSRHLLRADVLQADDRPAPDREALERRHQARGRAGARGHA